jgi:hypothetical protein
MLCNGSTVRKRNLPHCLVLAEWARRFAVAFLWSVLIATRASAQDFQWWSEVDVTASVRTIDVLGLVVTRIDSTVPNPQFVGGGLEAEARVLRHVALTGGYLFVDLPQRGPLHVQLPLVAATTMWRVGRLYTADRNRFERLVGFGTSPIRYRNRLLADLPFGPGDRWHVFGDDEVFFDFSTSTWNQNRLQLGGGVRFRPGLALDMYYLQRNISGGVPTTHVFGTTLKVALASASGEAKR